MILIDEMGIVCTEWNGLDIWYMKMNYLNQVCTVLEIDRIRLKGLPRKK